ncbi:hypothetical protein AB0K00_27365 [Dactylosporangium sp. NPDC049525]|uniref:hypothetical protein n=1 Tax=Dactylosporangium sp. NPDC049525 TaxID=3154730 RepID=UPI00344516F9
MPLPAANHASVINASRPDPEWAIVALFLTDSTQDLTDSRQPPLSAAGRSPYLLDHYANLGASSASNSMLARPERLARKLHRIVEKPKPRYKHHLGVDAGFIDNVMTRLPWAARVAMNTRMYKLDSRTAVIQALPLPAAA